MFLTLGVTLAIVATLGFVKFKQIQAAIAQGEAYRPPPEAVTTVVARQQTWRTTSNAIGTVEAVQGVTVSADLPGTVDAIRFESGEPVRAGDVLVELDTRQERARLAAVEARRDLARVDFGRMKGLLEERVVSRAEYDKATATERQAEAEVAETEAAIDRKTIRAPFAGVLGLRQIDLGQYLSAGEPVVSLQSLDPIYVTFGLPQQSVGQVRIGRRVSVSSDDLSGATLTGRVTALDSVVDQTTRNVKVQVTLDNPGGRLRPGMFVQVEIATGTSRSVVPLPASAISYAPYGNSVFVVTDLDGPDGQTYRGVRQQFVSLGGARGDQVAVVSGVKPGEEVVTSGVFKLRNGVAVLVNNRVRPANDPAARPENS